MLNGTTHMAGNASGAARPGTACPVDLYIGTTLPSIKGSWLVAGSWNQSHLPLVKTATPVFATDRPTRRPLERFP